MTFKFDGNGLKFGRTWVDRIMGKVDKDQGVANAGKVLGIGADGQVVPVEQSGGTTPTLTTTPVTKQMSSWGDKTVGGVEWKYFKTTFNYGFIEGFQIEFALPGGSSSSNVTLGFMSTKNVMNLGIEYSVYSDNKGMNVEVLVPISYLTENNYTGVNYVKATFNEISIS